jgi:hypothetical protein
MIKTIALFCKIIVTTIVALLASSCNFSVDLDGFGKTIKGSGNVISEKREVTAPFKSIEVEKALDVVLEQSSESSIIVEADDNVIKEITTKIEGGVLKISCSTGSYVNIKSRKILVKMPEIENITASASATIKSANTLKGNNINIHSSSAGEFNLDLEFDNINTDASSGSEIELKGKSLKADFSVSSGSSINAKNLLANDILAKASSGGELDVHPILSLNASASSGANISYSNIPKNIQRSESSGGSVSEE